MNIAPTYTPSQIALHEAAKARARKRFMAARMVAANTNENASLSGPEAKEHASAAKVEVDQNHHVLAWRVWINRFSGQRVRIYIEQRCAEAGIDASKVLSASRRREVTNFRQLLMWEIKMEVRPEMSLPEIGRVFARDHTTVLSAIRKICKEKGIRYVGTYDHVRGRNEG